MTRRLRPRWLLLATLGTIGLFPTGQTEGQSTQGQNKPQTKPLPRTRVVDPAEDSVSLVERAAAALVNGQQGEAAALLEQHVEEHPEAILVRAQLAELLFRMERLQQARLHFELFIASAQPSGVSAFRYLIHSHSRLVEIATREHQSFDEHINRGIGLFILAGRRATEANQGGDHSVASLLARAVDEFQSARQERPTDARVHWYLHCSWMQLGQVTLARQALQQADRYAILSRLTPHERLQLSVAQLPTQDDQLNGR